MRVRTWPFIVILFSLTVLLTACSGALANPLVGQWQTDLGGDNGMMTLDFSEDGTFQTSFSSQPALTSEGTYRIVEEDRIEVITQTPEGNEQTVEMDFRIENRKLTLLQAGESQVFYRLGD